MVQTSPGGPASNVWRLLQPRGGAPGGGAAPPNCLARLVVGTFPAGPLPCRKFGFFLKDYSWYFIIREKKNH